MTAPAPAPLRVQATDGTFITVSETPSGIAVSISGHWRPALTFVLEPDAALQVAEKIKRDEQ